MLKHTQVRDSNVKRLVDAARHGDPDAFDILVERFQDMAVGYAYARLSDFHTAEDVAQEAFLTAYQNLDALRTSEAFASWFRRILFTKCERVTRRSESGRCGLGAASGSCAAERTRGYSRTA